MFLSMIRFSPLYREQSGIDSREGYGNGSEKEERRWEGGMGELYEEGVEVYSVYISRIIVSVQSVGWRSLLTSQI